MLKIPTVWAAHLKALPPRWRWAGAVAAALLLLTAWLLSPSVPAGQAQPAQHSTGAIGQIVPGGGVVDIAGLPGSQVVAVYVHQGQTVKAGAPLMLTQSVNPSNDAALAKLQLATAKDLSVQQVDAQTLTVHLAEIRRDQAEKALLNYQSLGSSVSSKKDLNRLSDEAAEARMALDVERAKLRVISTQAQGNLRSAQRQYDLLTRGTELRAPVDGTILRIAKRPGEQLGSDPAIQMGDLRTMYVVCQVYEGDLLRLTPGMGATIRAQPLAKPLRGHIEEVGRLIDTRARLGEVRIRLDSPEPANRLVGLEVEVIIDR